MRSSVLKAAARSAVQLQARGMATEKQIFTQMVSTKNISKITSSMKMVSAAKLKGDENRLAVARPFNEWTYAINGPPVYVEGSTFDDLPQKTLVVPLTSDKGLCGGVNTFINKSAKIVVAAAAKSGKEVDFVIVGDKGRAQMRRAFADNIKRSATDVVSPGTYALAGALAEEVAAAGAADYDAVMIIYNSYVNAAVYKQMYKMIKPMNGEGDDEPMMEYEFEPETKSEILADLYEYSLTSQLFHSFMDGAAAEQSSRMTAMSNATANANEMISSLTLRYNRARQARITTDLIEIISGAAALEEK
jgi:F-type H+-transporting ATPase subunit gamma